MTQTAANTPIFIVGPPRSGTHLMRFCLSQHSRIFIAPETAFFIRAYGNRHLDKHLFSENRTGVLVDELIAESGDPTMKDFAASSDKLKSAVASANNYRDFATGFFGTMATNAGKSRWGEKTPLHVLYLPQVFALFPEARVIIVMREAKNTMASTLKSGHVRASFFNAFATYLRIRKEGERWAKSANVMRLDYETFVADPESNLRAICTFLGEDYEPAMLEPGMMDSSYTDDVMRVRSGITIAPDDPEKWRRGLSVQQGKLIDQALAGRLPLVTRDGLRLASERLKLALRLIKNRAGYFYLGRPGRRWQKET